MPTKCKEKQASYSKKYYEKNKALVMQRARAWTVEARGRMRRFAARYKKWVGCSRCGYKKYHGSLHFHHLSHKDDAISNLIHKGVSIERLKREIKKCVVLCANCHHEEHGIVVE